MTEKAYLFNGESADILRDWWKGLEEDRGERAVLRRAPRPTDVVFSPAYHRLLNHLRGKDYHVNREALAAVAGLLARVTDDTGNNKTFAEEMASPRSKDTDGARVKDLRFRRLLTVTVRDELYPMLIRVVRLLDNRVNLISMADSVYWWNENTRKEWAYDYYATAPQKKNKKGG